MITELRIPYPDFKLGELIDPEEHDLNNLYLQNKINDLITFANTLTGEIPGGATGAELMSMKPIAPFTQTKIQTFLDALVARLQSKVGPNTGASLIGNVTLSKFPGDNIGAQLDAINTFLSGQFVTNTTIVDGAISGSKLQDFTVTNQKIANASVTNAKLANNSIMNVNINDNAVTRRTIANGAIDNSKIENGSILDTALANGAVTNPKILAGAVTGSKIATNNIITSHLVDANVTRAKIADRAVDKTKMETLSVDDTILANGSVTNIKLGERVVTSSKIGTQQVKVEHLDPALLDLLPEGQLTQKVLQLETDMGQVQLVNTRQDGDIQTNTTNQSNHEKNFRVHTYFGLDTGYENRKIIEINPAIVSYQSGLTVRFESRVTNTGPVTIQVNSMAEKSIVKPDGSALSAGDMKEGSVYTISYSGKNGNFTLQGSGGSSLPAYYGTGADGNIHLKMPINATWVQTPTLNSVNLNLQGSAPYVVWQWDYGFDPVPVVSAEILNATSSYAVQCAVEGSIDGVTWTNHNNIGLDTTPRAITPSFSSVPYRYLRVRVTSWTGTPPNPVNFNHTGNISVTTGTIYTWRDSIKNTCIRHCENFTLDAGVGISTFGVMSAMIIFAKGDITINGTILMDSKGYLMRHIDYLREIIPSTHNRNEILGKLMSLKGGNGGGGGQGGVGTGGTRMSGGTGQTDQLCIGGMGGGGGGGSIPHSGYVGGSGMHGGYQGGTNGGGGAPIKFGGMSGFSLASGQGGTGAAFDQTVANATYTTIAYMAGTGYSYGSGSGGGGASYCYHNGTNSTSSSGSYGVPGVGNGGVVILIAGGKITIGPNAQIICNGAVGGGGGSGAQAGANAPFTTAYASGGGGGGGSGGGTISILYGGEYVNQGGALRVNGGGGGPGGPSSSTGAGSGSATAGLPGGAGAMGEIGIWKVGT